MDNKELLSEIDRWHNILIRLPDPDNEYLYELAFFKIFVKFEKFIIDIFILYAIGKKSSLHFKPKRKLGFKSKEHLEAILKNSTSTYIDYPRILVRASECIFDEKQNPFTLIFSDSTFSDNYKKMQIIRNFIAHESAESKEKYKTKVLDSFNIEKFISVIDFLKKPNKNRISYYTFNIDIIKKYSNILVNPEGFFN